MPALALWDPSAGGAGALLTQAGQPGCPPSQLGPGGHQHRWARENSPEEREATPGLRPSLVRRAQTWDTRTAPRGLVWGVVRMVLCSALPWARPSRTNSQSGRDPSDNTLLDTVGQAGPPLQRHGYKPGSSG